jgi:nucleotide-binding universal stress UspA family protein
MPAKILIPTDLSTTSNSIFPCGATIAQAFPGKLYLLHVMDPASVHKPERLEDFPHLSRMFALERETAFLPPLRSSVPVAKMYSYSKDVAKMILSVAEEKQIDLICMAATTDGVNLAWWSAGDILEKIVKKAACSVLCMRGRPVKDKDWKRPRFRHILLLTELAPGDSSPLAKVLPWVQRFNSMLHIFPMLSGEDAESGEQTALRELCQLDAVRTNVLLFSKPENRMNNLLNFVGETPIDLIVMTPRTRARFSNRLISDIFVRLLRVTDSPILLLR